MERSQRVRAACARCRAQKLRCDLEKPCTSCLRRGVDCVPRIKSSKRARRRQDGTMTQHENEDTTTPSLSLKSTVDPQHDPARSSWLGLAEGLLDNKEKISESQRRARSALPWALDAASASFQQDQIPISDIVRIDLPEKSVLDEFLDAYFDQTQWFILVFHEPSFRQKYERIFKTGFLQRSESNFVRLCLVLFSLGARLSTIATNSVGTAMELEKLRKCLMSHVEADFMSILDIADIHTVQICLLWGTYMTYEGRLTRSFALIGSAITVARLIQLGYEPSWKAMSPEAKEEHRRTWWVLATIDKFDAVKNGRSTGIKSVPSYNITRLSLPWRIRESQSQVGLPEDIGDLDFAPELPSLIEYHRCKLMLYGIVSPILSDRTASPSHRLMKSVDSRLQEWESSLPSHLQWGSAEEIATSDETPERQTHARRLRLQALALHSSYNILKIILHKPYAFVSYSEDDSQAKQAQARASRHSIFETALRVSSLAKRFPVASLDVLGSSAAATQCGITMFTAGVVLGYLALINPRSPESQMCEQGIKRIISIQSNQKARHVLMSPQSAHVLEDLITIIEKKRSFPRTQRLDSAGRTQNLEATQHVSGTNDFVDPQSNASVNHDSVETSSGDNQLNLHAAMEWASANAWTSPMPDTNFSWPLGYMQNNVLYDVRQVMIDHNAMNTTFDVLFGDVVSPDAELLGSD